MIVLPLIIFRIREEKKKLLQPYEFAAISFHFVFFFISFFQFFVRSFCVNRLSFVYFGALFIYSLAHSKCRRVTGERAAVKTTLSCAYLIDILSFTIKCTNMPYTKHWLRIAAIAHRGIYFHFAITFCVCSAPNNHAHIQHSLHLFVGIWHFHTHTHSGYFWFCIVLRFFFNLILLRSF